MNTNTNEPISSAQASGTDTSDTQSGAAAPSRKAARTRTYRRVIAFVLAGLAAVTLGGVILGVAGSNANAGGQAGMPAGLASVSVTANHGSVLG